MVKKNIDDICTLVTIIVPVYNTEKYLSRCLDSLINQTLDSLEILLIDDGSTDGSGYICDEYAHNYKNVKVIHQDNLGQAEARNTGLKMATGEFIGFVDSDDWITPCMYEMLLNCMLKEEADVVECEYIQTNKNLEDVGHEKEDKYSMIVFFNDDILKQHLMGKYFKSVIWNKLYRRDVINCNFRKDKHLEDIFWLYPILSNCKKGIHINRKMYFYFQRENSLSNEPYSLKKLEAVECAYERALYIASNKKELIEIAEANKIAEGMFHYQKLLINSNLDSEKVYRKKLYSFVRRNQSKWWKAVSFKQEIWDRMFLIMPNFTCKVRNKLKIGV